MSISVTASVTFQAETMDAANEEVASWALPEGANVYVSAVEQLNSGTVIDGIITPPPPADPPPESQEASENEAASVAKL